MTYIALRNLVLVCLYNTPTCSPYHPLLHSFITIYIKYLYSSSQNKLRMLFSSLKPPIQCPFYLQFNSNSYCLYKGSPSLSAFVQTHPDFPFSPLLPHIFTLIYAMVSYCPSDFCLSDLPSKLLSITVYGIQQTVYDVCTFH